jgi:hypothetical protein
LVTVDIPKEKAKEDPMGRGDPPIKAAFPHSFGLLVVAIDFGVTHSSLSKSKSKIMSKKCIH